MRRSSQPQTFALAGSEVLDHSARSRLLLLFAIAAVVLTMVIYLYYNGIPVMTSSAAAKAERLRIAKETPACYSDEECPNGTFCSDGRLCVPLAALPPLAPPLFPPVMVTQAATTAGEALGRALDQVLGRGRGGEGADVQLVSTDRKGQMK